MYISDIQPPKIYTYMLRTDTIPRAQLEVDEWGGRILGKTKLCEILKVLEKVSQKVL